jgi:eukaryotic-like serine/threonine-protein kinase
MSLAPGLRLGRYEVVDPLGVGGMGEVYRGLDTLLRRQVAIKVLSATLADSAEALNRFEREARAIASLSHPNIVVLYDVGFEANVPYAVMELLEGETLGAEIRRGGLSLDGALDRALQVARGLDAAHSCGVVHRDLKPDNVFVTRTGLVKILDFGLARLERAVPAGDASTTDFQRTMPGRVMGTLLYMSPEQLDNVDVDARTDIFSFGVVLHELLTGRNPFNQANQMRAMAAILNGQPTLAMDASIPARIQELVVACLSPERRQRPQSATDLVRALSEVRTGEVGPGDSGEVKAPWEAASGQAVAVLPFVDMSPGRDQQYFCEGMAEEIINALSQIEGLRVAARTSTFQLAARSADIQEIGRRLGVTTVVEGSVRAMGDHLRVTAKLINVSDGYHVWSARFDRQLADVFELQDEISASVAGSLRGRLRTTRTPRPPGDLVPRDIPGTTGVDAYRLFLKGRHFRYTRDDFVRALDCFEQAVALKPEYVEARAGLAEAYLLAGNCCYRPPRDAYARARLEIDAALEMAPSSPEAVMVDAILQFLFHRDWRAAERRFNEAIALSPDSVQAHSWYALMLTALGRHDEAIRLVEHAREIDPVSPYAGSMTGMVYLHAGESRRAIAELERALEIEEHYLFALTWLGVAAAASGAHDRGIAAFEQCLARTNRSSYSLGFYGWSLAVAGRDAEARAVLAECESRARAEKATTVGAVWLAAALGELEQAWTMYQQADEERQDLSLFLGFRGYDPMRGDPRFALLARRIGVLAT